MRIAVCFSGEIRTGVKASENIKEFIGDMYKYCDFFIHTWRNNTYKPFFGYNGDYSVISEVNIDSTFENIIKIYKPKKINITENNMTPDSYRLRQPLFYSWVKSIEYMKERENLHNFEYDYVIKLRFDNIFNKNVKLEQFINKVKSNTFITEEVWINQGQITINDVFFLSNSKIMKKAIEWCDFFNKCLIENKHDIILPDIVSEHSYLAHFLISNGIYPYNSMLNEQKNLAIYRKQSLRYSPTTDFEKCYEMDKLLHWDYREIEHLTIDDLKKDVLILKNENKFIIPPNIEKILNNYENSNLC